MQKNIIKNVELLAGGQSGVDRAIHDVCIKYSISSYGYVPDYWKYDEKKYNFKKLVDSNETDCDLKMLDEADCFIGFRLNIKKSGRATDKLTNYVRTGKLEHVQLNKPYNENYEIFEDGSKPVIIIWDLSNDTLDNTVNIINTFIDKHNIKKLMFSGPLQRTWDKKNLNGEQLVTKLLNKLDIIENNSSF